MTRYVAMLGRALLVLLVGGTGFYLVYYLYRWEWVRAQIAGVAFVAALVVGACSLVLRRIDRLERRLMTQRSAAPDSAHQEPGDVAIVQAVNGGAVDKGDDGPTLDGELRPSFPWLKELLDPNRTSVFIPVLFAAGIVVSVVASLVERLSTALHRKRPRSSKQRSVTSRRARLAGLAVGTTLVVGLATLGLYAVSHYRPVDLGEGTTELTVDVRAQGRQVNAAATLDMLARYCSTTTSTGISVRRVEPVDPGTARLYVSPVLDEQMLRRYGGCLQDAQLERYWLDITDSRVVSVPLLSGELHS
jgi:hypothetical protein